MTQEEVQAFLSSISEAMKCLAPVPDNIPRHQLPDWVESLSFHQMSETDEACRFWILYRRWPEQWLIDENAVRQLRMRCEFALWLMPLERGRERIPELFDDVLQYYLIQSWYSLGIHWIKTQCWD